MFTNVKTRLSSNMKRFRRLEELCPIGRFAGRCPAGQYSETGYEPCVQCPKGSFQTLSGSTNCDPCPDHQSTLATGSKLSSDCRGILPFPRPPRLLRDYGLSSSVIYTKRLAGKSIFEITYIVSSWMSRVGIDGRFWTISLCGPPSWIT